MTGMTWMGTLPQSRRASIAVAAAVLALLATACTDDRPTPTVSDPNIVAPGVADTVPGKAPLPAERCNKSGNVPAAKVVVTTADGVHLAGVRFGSGARGVLLLPQRDADFCPWWDYADELRRAGFHVLAIDMRGTGLSEEASTADYTADAAAGVAELKRAGAAKVVIVGASLGGATALVTAGRIPDQVSGVVALSYPEDTVDVTGDTGSAPHTPAEAAPLITAPLMLCYASGDRDVQGAKPQQLATKARGPAKQVVGRSGVSHGWDMLKVGDDDVRPDVLGFLQSYA
jgi:pimeloyl-ACP methyl ester carboxylesterase